MLHTSAKKGGRREKMPLELVSRLRYNMSRNKLVDYHEKPCMIMSVVYMLVVGGPVSCTAGGSHLVQVRPHINLKMIEVFGTVLCS